MSQAGTKEVSTGYIPRPLQALIHSSLLAFRFIVLVCHRRFGKTILVINEMIDRAYRNELENPQYAYIAPTYSQAKRIAWEYLKKYTKDLPYRQVFESELKIVLERPDRKDKITFQLLGSDNPDAIAGMYLDGVIMDEFSLQNPKVWTIVVRPAISDRKGWAIFIGTPRGQNHFFDIYQTAKKHPDSWFSKVYRASETGLIDENEMRSIREVMSQEEIDQEYECSFSAAMIGSYYGTYIEQADKAGRIGNVSYNPLVPVYTAWDLGFNDTTSIWFYQLVGTEIHVIDYIEDSGKGLEFYVNAINSRNYLIDRHFLPHDANVHDLGSGKTRIETLRELGIGRTEVLEKLPVDDRISATRLTIPRCWFNGVKCEDGLASLRNYQKKWDDKRQCFLNKPLHDWASNGADGFGYMCLSIRGNGAKLKEDYQPNELCVGDFSIF